MKLDITHAISAFCLTISTTLSWGAPTQDVSFKFMATSDPQYDNRGDHSNSDDTLMKIQRKVLSRQPDYSFFTNANRGLIIAGDLTQNARPNDELKMYQSATQRIRDSVGNNIQLYAGIGNHDATKPTWEQEHLGCVFNQSYCVDPVSVMRVANGDARAAAEREKLYFYQENSTVYSWDWRGVHFINVGVAPMDDPNPAHPGVDPGNGLSGLRNDLQKHVGNSSTPVVIVSHYGFDGFSTGWWTEEQRSAFTQAISGYHVIAMLSGHQHLSPGDERVYMFKDASGREIPDVLVGAAVERAFCEFQFSSSSDSSGSFTVDAYDASQLDENGQGAPVKSYRFNY